MNCQQLLWYYELVDRYPDARRLKHPNIHTFVVARNYGITCRKIFMTHRLAFSSARYYVYMSEKTARV